MEDSNRATSAYDHLMKILIIGDTSSSKRKLLGRYLRDKELTDTTTLGLDYKLKDVEYGGKSIKLQLWDTAGQERFRSVTASYYRGAHGALLVFTLIKETSFVGLDYWLEEIKMNAPEKFQVILVAMDTNCDEALGNLEIARQFAMEKQLELLVCDIEEQTQVDTTFLTLIKNVMASWENNVNESIHLDYSNNSSSKESGCAC